MPNCKHGIDERYCGACSNATTSPEARRQRLKARAAGRTPANDAEREAYEAVFAYEEAISHINGRTTRAGRTWPMIEEKGVIAAVEGIVTKPQETRAYQVLIDMGLEDMTFEAVVLRHQQFFTAQAVVASERRLKETRDGTARRRLPPLPKK